ncbi:MAG TPA: cytochrome c [Polyangiaceae bacterium]|nr:cytochrome c [Polyangiaceae bacterium]
MRARPRARGPAGAAPASGGRARHGRGAPGRLAPAALAALALAAGCERGRAAGADGAATLAFLREGATLRTVRLDELAAQVPPERWSAFDPYYNKEKRYRALPLRPVLERGFAGVPGPLESHQYVLRARDGYSVPIEGARLLGGGAYLAIADDEVPGWEPIGPQRANPGPVYLVWREPHQRSLEEYPRPWQLVSVEITRFERLYGHTVPEGEAPGSAAMRGFALFRAECVRCHAVNREGGRVGPDLNVPKSIVEYRPVDQIKAYIRDPRAFRYSSMPPHPHLGEADLDALVAYFEAMRRRKHDPEAAAASAPAPPAPSGPAPSPPAASPGARAPSPPAATP